MTNFILVPREGKQQIKDLPLTTPPEVEEVIKQDLETGFEKAAEEPIVNNDLPPISEMIGSKFGSVLAFVITPFTWLLALPIRTFAWIVIKVRTRRYDPEKLTCPACGFKGDSGTNGKTCYIAFVRTAGKEQAAIQHFCLRCGCDKHYSQLLRKAEEWMAKDPISNLRVN